MTNSNSHNNNNDDSSECVDDDDDSDDDDDGGDDEGKSFLSCLLIKLAGVHFHESFLLQKVNRRRSIYDAIYRFVKYTSMFL